MTWGIVGSRSFQDWDRFVVELDRLMTGQVVDRIVSGGADGADSLAERFALERGIPITVHQADWERYRSKAGPKRNRLIVRDSDVIVAFWVGVSTGTKNTIRRAREAGKTVHIISIPEPGDSHENL